MNTPETDRPPVDPILVVDDEKTVLATLQQTLQRCRYETVGTSDPLIALEHLKNRPFSVIISDQMMPEMSGLELLAHARQLQPNATRILITAVVNLGMVIDAINQGDIFRFIVKPWLHEEFIATIQNGVQRYELICQNTLLEAASQTLNGRLVELNRSLEEQSRLTATQNGRLSELNAALDTSLASSLDLCVHTLQSFYPSLGSQARRACQLCRDIAIVLDLGPEDQRALESGALLHDIGLVGIPRRVIRRWQEEPHLLEPTERGLIERHPVLSQELAAHGCNLEIVGKIIRAHHENFDGSGYPDRLAGDDIPWLGRLLAVAVTHASSRLTEVESTDQIKAASGQFFDPEAVRIFLQSRVMEPNLRKERKISLADLRPGMIMAQNVYAPNDRLLLPQGQRLDAAFIEKVLSQNRVLPMNQTLVVYG